MPQAQSAITLFRRMAVRVRGRSLRSLPGRAALGLGLLFAVLAHAAPALADRAMSTRFNADVPGNITIAANTLMVCPATATTPTPGCTAARNTPPIASGTNNGLNNNSYKMQYVNTAPGAVPGLGASFDSSTATLSLPSTATVLFAGLYWGADTSAGTGTGLTGSPAPGCTTNAATCLRNEVGFEAPGDLGYRALTAATTSPAPPATSGVDQSSGAVTRYSAFFDVTSIVQAAGAGSYSVADVEAGTGGDRFAGWALVVAYQDPGQPPRDLTVDDGLVTVSSGSPPISIPVSGFRTPPTGTVHTTLGFVGYEGDSGLTGDSASLNGVPLSDGANPAGNFWSSAISNFGTNVTTRNPNDVNNFAVDAKLINAVDSKGNAILPNNATSATVQVTTSGDTYYPAVVTFATDLYSPNIVSSKSVTNLTHPGGPDQLGDTLRYTVSYTNTGSDSAANFVMRDPIPSGTTYAPGTLHIIAGPLAVTNPNPTDALGDDPAEFNPASNKVIFRLGIGANATSGGRIAPGETDTVTFDVTIDADDSPGQQIVNQATANFNGLTLGTPFFDTSPQVTNTVSAPSLTLAKSHTGSFIGGQATTFTLDVSNVGNLGTDGSTVTVTDPFPASSFTSLANAGGDGWSCAIAGLTLTCTRSDVLAGGNSYPPILVDATVQDPAPATVTNTATVSGGGSAPATGSDGGGASGLADVSITKSVTPTTVFNGNTVTYTLTVQNAGPSSAQDVTVDDPIDPASFSNVSVQSSQGNCTTLPCSLGTLAANGTATITITATATPNTSAGAVTLANTATVSSSTPDPNPNNNSDSASVTVLGTADLSIAKTGTANPNQGGADSYTLTVTNNGPDTAESVVVNDVLPSQFTATSATGATCSPLPTTGGTLVCTLGNVPTNTTITITINGTVAAGTAGQTIADSAAVSSDTGDPDLSNNNAGFSQLVGPAADLTMAKAALLSVGGAAVTNPLSLGETFVYALSVTNNGPSPADNVTVTDTLPTAVTLVSAPTDCTLAAGTVTCSLGTVAVGQTVTTNLGVEVTTGLASAVTNTATVSSTTLDPNPSGKTSDTATVGVGAVANLALTKNVSPQTANVGDTVTYTITATNDVPAKEIGGVPASGLATTGGLVTDTLPAGVQFLSSTPAGVCTAAGQTVTCHLGAIAQMQTVTATYTAQVTSAAAGQSVTNLATITPEAVPGFPAVPDFNPNDDSDSATLNVNPEADVSLSKTASNTHPAVDDEVDYTLTASNAGPNDATGVTIRDSLPAGLDFIDASPGCDNSNVGVTCDIGTLASGASTSVTVRTRTTAAIAGTSVGNLASVTANELDPDLSNNQATATIDVQPLVDLALKKVASNTSPQAGGSVTYTLSLVNNGPSTATGVKVTDPLPAGLSFAAASASQGSCSASGQTVTCALGTLAAGGSAVMTITAHIAPSAAGSTLANTARASANEPIARPENLTSEASITPTAGPPPAAADLSVVKTVNHKDGRVGEPLTYTITVTNHGPATASSPTVTDAFSAGVKVDSIHSTSGSCTTSHPITCKLGSIASGAHVTITIVARPKALGELHNSASVTSSTPDPDSTNNLSKVTTKVGPGRASLKLTKTAGRKTVAPGQAFSYTITVRSLGPEAALAVKVCDKLGSGMTYITVPGATFRHGTPCWTIHSLSKGKRRKFVVKVRAPMVSGPRPLTNVATASADGVRTHKAHSTVELVGAPPPPPGGGVTG